MLISQPPGIGQLFAAAVQQHRIRTHPALLWPPPRRRGRATYRTSLVCDNRDMPGHDHLPRRDWGLVPRHVYSPGYGQDLGMDRRRTSRAARAGTTTESPSLPLATQRVPVAELRLRHVYPPLHGQHGYSAGETQHDVYVSV